MNKIFKYAFAAVACIIAFAATSCSSSDDYEMAAKLAGAQVYFPNTIPTKLSLPVGESSYGLPIYRVNTNEELTVPLSVKYEGEAITIPASVTFAAGQAEALIPITWDIDKLGYDKFEDVTIAIDNDEYTTPYGSTAFSGTMGVAAPWSSIGKGVVIDNYLFGDEATVEFYKNDFDPTLYRIANPIAVMLGGEDLSADVSQWLYVRILKKGDQFNGVTIPEDDMVYFYSDGAHDSMNTGYTHPTYNDDVCWVFPGTFTKYGTPEYWMHNIVLDRQEDGSVGAVQLAPFYYMWNTGGWDQTQKDGIVTIYFPGYEPKDYALDIKFEGRLIDSKENGSAVFNITLGADIASAKYLMADGKDAEAVYMSILAGADGVQEMTASGQVKISYKEPGDKTLVVVGYDAEGNEVAAVYETINIPASGDVDTWTALYVGDYYHRVECYDESGEGVWSANKSKLHDGSTLYISNTDETRYKISPWIDNELIFTMDSNNQITVVNQNTGYYVSTYDTYIAASDLITSQKDNLPSEFDEEDETFRFELTWHDLDDVTVENGEYGLTEDEFVLTGEANAPSHLKMCTPKKAPKFNIKKKFNYLLEKDVKSSLHAPYKNFAKPNVKKTARLKK